MRGVLGELARMHEAGGPGVTDEERRDHEVDLVYESGGEELGMDGAATLHHQAFDFALGKVVQHDNQINRRSGTDHGRDTPERLAKAAAAGSGV